MTDLVSAFQQDLEGDPQAHSGRVARLRWDKVM